MELQLPCSITQDFHCSAVGLGWVITSRALSDVLSFLPSQAQRRFYLLLPNLGVCFVPE